MDQSIYQNNSGLPMNQYNNPNENQMPLNQAPIANMMPYRMVYPEVFYRVQPFIMNVCDQMDACNYMMPNQEMMDQMSDNIHDDLIQMYPDMAQYDSNYNNATGAEQTVIDVIGGSPFFFRPHFRRRGLLRDLISILLFSEFQRRRRRHY